MPRDGPHPGGQGGRPAGQGRFASAPRIRRSTTRLCHCAVDLAVRQSGLYRILTVDECVDLLFSLEAENRSFMMNPLVAGLFPDFVWPSLELFVFDEVLPRFRSKSGTTGPTTFMPGKAPVRAA